MYETDQYRLWQHGLRKPAGGDCQPGIRPDQADHPGCAGTRFAGGRNLWAAHPGGDYHRFGPRDPLGSAARDRCKPAGG